MPDFCAAYGCSHERNTQTKSAGITFHRFPKDSTLRREWELAVKRKGFAATKRSLLCSEHFKADDFDRTGQTVRLRHGVKPSVFNFPPRKRSQKQVPSRTTQSPRKAEESLPVDLPQHFHEADPQSNVDHNYALPASPTALKTRLGEALARVESLERKERNSMIRERRAKKNVHALLEDLREKNLINAELKDRFDFYWGADERMENDPDCAPSLHLGQADSTVRSACKKKKKMCLQSADGEQDSDEGASHAAHSTRRRKGKQLRKKTASEKRRNKTGESDQEDGEDDTIREGAQTECNDEEEPCVKTRQRSPHKKRQSLDREDDTSQEGEQTDCNEESPNKRMRRLPAAEAQERITQSTDNEQDSHDASDDASDSEMDSNTDVDEQQSQSSEESSESEEGTEEPLDPSDEEWKSKNNQIVWSPTNAETLRYFPAACATPGPTGYALARITSVKSCFDLFMTQEIKQYVLDKTNLHGRRSVKNWKDIDMTELDAFIGLLILAGIYRSRHESTKSLWNENAGRAIFQAVMSYKSFDVLNAHLQLEDDTRESARQKNDKLSPIRTIWDKWLERLPILFNPGQDVCIGEQFVPFRGSCEFSQYTRNKRENYGIKIWVTCDVATSYAWKMQIYTGKPADGTAEVNQGKRVALDLTEGLRGHTVTCDHFFTSYSLAEQLLKKKVALVGAVRLSKPELPCQLLQKKHRVQLSSLFAFTKTHTLVSYLPKRRRNMLFLSTRHREPGVSSKHHKKPNIVLDYNSCKGAVDNLNKCIGSYSCKRKTSRWPVILFSHMLDVSAYNAFVLWTATDPSWNKSQSHRRRLFLEELGKTLVSPKMSERKSLPRSKAAAAIVMDLKQWQAPVEDNEQSPAVKKKSRKQCKLCTVRSARCYKTCIRCRQHVCKGHSLTICTSCYTEN